MKIKPIETIYNGYRFRSRLEARWAVFFDALDIKYEYEKEGYDFGDGVYYLPDFWLPNSNVFAEVKPVPLSPTELKKCELLTRGTKKGVMLLVGPPNLQWYAETYDISDMYNDFTYDEKCEMSVKYGYKSVHDFIYASDYTIVESPVFCDGDDVINAIYKSRSARFEFDR